MKKITLFCLFLVSILTLNAQMEISVVPEKNNFDSLVLQEFNGMKYVDFQVIKPNKKNTFTFKSKPSVHAGVYRLKADTAVVAEILLSDSKNQKFKIMLRDSGNVFENSDENNAYIAYLKQMDAFKRTTDKLNKEAVDLDKSTLPDYMKKGSFNNLREQYQANEKAKSAYTTQILEQYQGTLLASLVKINLELPPAPQQCYQYQLLMYHYIAEHTFDQYPFDDDRLAYCEAAAKKIVQYGNTLYQFEETDGVPHLQALLSKLEKCSDETYFFFFNHLEKVIGTLTSPFWTEPLYIAMLKNALARPNLETAKKVRYKRQLSLLDKNLKGSILPNFKIKLSNDSITDLYSVESEFLLLYFQNPDCPTCTQVREEMAGMESLKAAIASGKLTVLTVYFEEDEALWRRYLEHKANPDYLHGWDYLHDIETNELFDLRIIPYVFLLDKDKRVIKKDLLHNEIERYIKQYVK